MDFKENKGWEAWMKHHPDKDAGLLRNLWKATGTYKNDHRPDVESGLAALKGRISQANGGRVVRIIPFRRVMQIAAGVALLAAAFWAFKNFLDTDQRMEMASAEAGANTSLQLTDGTQVSLNQVSELSFPETFAKNERRVKLTGEAFFEVAKDKNRPFIIETASGEVQVLGTSFNVRSYPSEDFFEVFVKTGKVAVTLQNSDKRTELTPGQVFRLAKSTGKALTAKDDSGIPLAWRNGVLSLKGKTVEEIFTGIERLYSVKVDLKTEQPADCRQTLTLEKDKLTEALLVLNTSCPALKITKISASQYSVTGRCCE
ncbi:MAG: FecR domain-containing protein [Bacteroidetes bacterium]|nr:FecR domain-containing protein [Bacteroidota bacterium]